MTVISQSDISRFDIRDHERILPAEALTVISFDLGEGQAAIEEREERSLSLALRRRRVRSEVLRLAPNADMSLLEELCDGLGERRLLLIVRGLTEIAGRLEAVKRLRARTQTMLVVIVGGNGMLLGKAQCRIIELQNDDRETIDALAEALTR